MNFTLHQRRRTPSVIIVSLIDVLLVVLIFLMVSTAFKREQPVLKLALPESRTAQAGASADAKPLIITIASNAPFFFVGTRPVTYDTLQGELRSAVQRDPNCRVAIRADRRAPFGEVTKVIDAAKLAQVASLNFYTERPAR
jgi:biopolymer transport protein ExbD